MASFLSHAWCWVKTKPHTERYRVANLNWLYTAESPVPWIIVPWSCDWLDWFSLIIIIIIMVSNSLLHHPLRKSSFFLVAVGIFLVGCLFVQFGEVLWLSRTVFQLSPWVSLAFEILVLRWATALPDQHPPPDQLENLLIWVDAIKVIPLAYYRMSLEFIVGNL